MHAIRLISLFLLAFSLLSTDALAIDDAANAPYDCHDCHAVAFDDVLFFDGDLNELLPDTVYAFEMSFESIRNGGNIFSFMVTDYTGWKTGQLVQGPDDLTPLTEELSFDRRVESNLIVERTPSDISSRTYYWLSPSAEDLPLSIDVIGEVVDGSSSGTSGGGLSGQTWLSIGDLSGSSDGGNPDSPHEEGAVTSTGQSTDGSDASTSSSLNRNRTEATGGCGTIQPQNEIPLALLLLLVLCLGLARRQEQKASGV